MLAEILNTAAKAHRGVSLDELTRRLGREAAVVEAALDLLVRKGKLVECSEATFCGSCSRRALCMAIMPAERRFILPGAVDGNIRDRAGSARRCG